MWIASAVPSPSSLSSRTRRNSWGAANSPGSEAAAPSPTYLQQHYGYGLSDRGWPDWDPSHERSEQSVSEYCKRIRSICTSPSDATRTSECVETLNALTMKLESDSVVRTQAIDAGIADLVLHTIPQKSARAPNAAEASRACARATRCLARSAQHADSLARRGARSPSSRALTPTTWVCTSTSARRWWHRSAPLRPRLSPAGAGGWCRRLTRFPRERGS